jgi:hypothetical protein
MSSLWTQAETVWHALSLDTELSGGAVRLARFGTGPDAGVALLARPEAEVRINGLPILGGLAILQHRDELLIGGRRFCFSAESTPLVTRFHLSEGARRPACPVCRGALQDEEEAVQCPGCGRWFHQIEASEGKRARACWTYAATCRFCRHPTSLNGDTAWRPEQEENE